ncbi:hypothetical protein [Deefgea sp. CFH1-16]|uniref:hypothetical protein n=1 Tax=Deefgea sp. CFH1-16 TaxID=2675457 RepID=UPI0015F633D9|nr:hypothetical protein [Deefgea sp. CFH1-16]MBM5575325.1 hypothetical protein [Deefgea sp. CFH1-16]
MAKSIRSIKSILDIVGSDRVFRLAVPVDGNEEIISKIGFGHELVEGVALVPAKIGKITSFNADGREIVRKDLPKERASIMFWGSSRDWHGNIHTSLRNRTVDRYPREWESAPEELLYLVSNGAVKYIVSRELDFSKDDSEAIMHIANLFLEEVLIVMLY